MGDTSSPELSRFRAAAADFIQTVESHPHLQRDAFLSAMSRCLAELYSSALLLPAVIPDTPSAEETPSAKHDSRRLFRPLKEKIGPLDGYWTVFDSTANANPVQGSLSMDISEIYSDLKRDLLLEQQGVTQADFLWELRFSFRSHWGRHLLGVLAAIYDRQVE
jgi:hypothetical protein